MTTGQLYAKVSKTDEDGLTVRADIMRRGTRTWPDRKVGAVAYLGHDGLSEEYAVYFEGHQVGVIERTGLHVASCPDLDDVYDDVFRAAEKVV